MKVIISDTAYTELLQIARWIKLDKSVRVEWQLFDFLSRPWRCD
jgi:hypothetical protein